jgi:hypothetical protein
MDPTITQVVLEQVLRQRLGGKQEALTLHVATIVTPPKRKDSVNEYREVRLEELSHVQICPENGDSGTCIRLIFGDKLYATCGEDADTLIDWAQKVYKAPIRNKISPFPEISFHHVKGAVQVKGQEIIPA